MERNRNDEISMGKLISLPFQFTWISFLFVCQKMGNFRQYVQIKLYVATAVAI